MGIVNRQFDNKRKKQLIYYLPIKNKESKNARLLIFSMMLLFLLIILLVINVVFLFLPNISTFENISNFAVWFMILYFFFYCNQESRLTLSANILLSLTMLVVFIVMFDTGGLYSVNKIYCLILICSSFLFTGKKSGIIYTSVTIVGLSFFYWGEINGVFDHGKNLKITESNYVYFSYLSCTIVASIILYALIYLIDLLETNNRLLTEMNILKLEENINNLEFELDKRMQEIAKLRTNIARDFHDVMGNKLAAISSISQMLSLENNFSEAQIQTEMARINSLSNEVFSGTKDFVWSLNIEKNNLFEVYIYIKDFGEKLFNSSNIDFISYPIDDALEQKIISLAVCSQLILIMKEVMTNALVHSKAQTVTLSLFESNHTSILEFEDNGVGFDPHTLSRINGLKNIQSRALDSGLKLQLTSQKNLGTKVSILL
jgi:signal transduction histidine kinase